MTDSATNGPIADVYYMTRYFDAWVLRYPYDQ
jgi:hypothetical protein